LDWLIGQDVMARITLFSRWEKDVIDWVRESPSDRWTTANIRNLQTQGVETGLQKFFSGTETLQLSYTYLSSRSDTLQLYSKYVLDYARHSLAALGTLGLPLELKCGQRVDYKRRADGRHYWVLDTRLARDFSKISLFLEVSNLLDTDYQEIRGVDMPGRWFAVGLQAVDLW
jgi:iron complex outermembrane receptor protein